MPYNPHLCPLSLSQVWMHSCPVSLTPIDIKEQQLLCYWIPCFIPYDRLLAKKPVTHFLRICIVSIPSATVFWLFLNYYHYLLCHSYYPDLHPDVYHQLALDILASLCALTRFSIPWIHPHPSINSRLCFHLTATVSLWMSRDISVEHV